MSVYIPKVRVGEPLQYKSLTVFPLFTEESSGIEYVLAEEALKGGTVEVKEVDESGTVSELLVSNKGDTRVLFIEGEELIGAKQNRILNTSILVNAGTTMKIPVSCVEAGRWQYRNRNFQFSEHYSPQKLRQTVKMSVHASLREGVGHRSDQGRVWEEIEAMHASLGTTSKTSAMSDTFEAYKAKIDQYCKKFSYVDRATGMAIALGGKIVAMDVFDKPSTCEKVWNRLLSGYAVDAIQEMSTADRSVKTGDVEHLIDKASNAEWEQVEAVGEGEEYCTEFDENHGSALVFEDMLVHGSMMSEQ